MDLKQLQWFVRVAELGGFTKAAAGLGVTQPTLSREIRRLEVELRKTLLQRNGRGVSLTDAGDVLLSRAKGLLQQVERVREEIIDLNGAQTGRVIMGFSPAAGTLSTASFVGAFKERFPRASLEIVQVKGSSMYEWLLSGRLDIALFYDPPPMSSVDTIPLRVDDLYLVSAARSGRPGKSSTISTGHLDRYPLILPTASRSFRSLLEGAIAKFEAKLNVVQQIDGVPLVLQLVKLGYGYTVFPEHIIQESSLVNELQLNKLVRPRLTRTLAIAVSSQHRRTRLTQESVSLLRWHFKNYPRRTNELAGSKPVSRNARL